MFKNKKEDLQELQKSHCIGSMEIPTELERIMQVEAEEIIKEKYNNLKGS